VLTGDVDNEQLCRNAEILLDHSKECDSKHVDVMSEVKQCSVVITLK